MQKLDEERERFARRRLEEPYPYLILDAGYEKVREDGAVRSPAVLVAIGINWEGRRNILAVELASRESISSWKELLTSLKQRSLHGVEFVVSDDHAGLRRPSRKFCPSGLATVLGPLSTQCARLSEPRKADDDCLQELRWIYDRRDAQEARQELPAWLLKWGKRYD